MMKPWSSQIEMTEGCFRRCPWCAVGNEKLFPVGVYKFMTLEMADKISNQLNAWLNKSIRIEFAMAGEPLLNPNYLKIIKIFNKNFPMAQLQLSTNGILLMDKFKQKVEQLFEAGLNLLVLDMYNPEGKSLKKLVWRTSFNVKNLEIIDFYKTKKTPYRNYGNKSKMIFLMSDISEKSGERTNRKLFNHAGNVDFEKSKKYNIFPILKPLEKKCTNVFRELVIKYNGKITICCMDFARERIVGDVNENTLKNIWESDYYMILRALLFRKNRSFLPCSKCDYWGGFRQGIGLFDPMSSISSEELLNCVK